MITLKSSPWNSRMRIAGSITRNGIVTYLVWRNGEVQRVADLSAKTCEK
jgi:hypothetical protein